MNRVNTSFLIIGVSNRKQQTSNSKYGHLAYKKWPPGLYLFLLSYLILKVL